MSQISALSVQTLHRPQAVRAAAPVAMAAREVQTSATSAAQRALPERALVAPEILGVLIEAQAHSHAGDRHDDHGHAHGGGHGHSHDHRPPTGDPPPVIQPPPVSQPPVSDPPASEPPLAAEPPPVAPVASDPAAPARTIAMIDRHFAEAAIAEAARSAFAAAAAQRDAAAFVAQGRAALAILQATETDMTAFRVHALGRYETVRRSTYG